MFLKLNQEIQSLHAQVEPTIFKPTFELSRDDFIKLISDKNAKIFFAELDGEAVGYVYFELLNKKETPHSYARKLIYIHHLGVESSVRWSGIGKALLGYVVDFAKSKGNFMPNSVKNEKGYSKVRFDSKAIKEAYNKRKTTKKFPTSISLPEDVVVSLKKIAGKKGIPYQTLMRMLIVEGLEKLEKAA